jgi:phosphoserine phosphatase
VLVVLDVDSTLIEDEVIDLLAESAGTLGAVARITEQAMNGDLDFAESLTARVATLAGLPAEALDEVRGRIRVTSGVPALVDGVHAAHGRIAVVSGGFHEILDPLAAGLGLDAWRANRLEIEGGRLTGRVRGPVIDAPAKAAALAEWAREYGVPMSRTVAIGDGANDLAMMAEAGLSVGFDAKAPVRGCADLVIDVRDLSQVLPLLGLSRASGRRSS